MHIIITPTFTDFKLKPYCHRIRLKARVIVYTKGEHRRSPMLKLKPYYHRIRLKARLIVYTKGEAESPPVTNC